MTKDAMKEMAARGAPLRSGGEELGAAEEVTIGARTPHLYLLWDPLQATPADCCSPLESPP